MTRTATTSVADAATDTKLSSTAVDAAAVTPAAPPPTLDDPASRAGSEEPTAASGSSETAHEHSTNDGKPMAKEVTDIEHMKVEDDPRKWSRTKKNVVLLVISATAFVASMASAIFFPATTEVQNDLGATSGQIAMTASLFILFQGLWPTGWAAVSEIVGRKPCYLASSTIFIAGSIGCALAPSVGALIGLRIMQSLGASAVMSIGAGSLADMYDTHERGRKMGIFYGAPLLAQSISPLVGGALTEASNWRSVFWFCVAYAGACFIAQIWLPEPFRKERSMAYRRAAGRAEAAAQQKAARKAEQASISSPISPISPDEKKTNMSSSTESAPPSPEEDDLPVIRPGLSKAVSMKDDKLTLDDGTSVEIKVNLSDVNPVAAVGAVVRKPNNLFISLYTGLLFGVSYCQLYTGGITFAQAPYSYDPLIVGLVLLAYGGGTILGSVAGGRYSDRTWARLKAQNGGKGEPEMRIKSTYPALILLPPSLIGYAWAVGRGEHVALCCFLLFLTGVTGIWAYSSLLAYIVDSNPGRASSAIAFNSACRGTAAAIASQVSDPLLVRMGHGPFYSAWGGVMAVGALSLLLVERRGKTWREGTPQQGRRILHARQEVPEKTAGVSTSTPPKSVEER